MSLVNLCLLDLIHEHILEETVLDIEIIEEEDLSIEGVSERQMIDVTISGADSARVVEVVGSLGDLIWSIWSHDEVEHEWSTTN